MNDLTFRAIVDDLRDRTDLVALVGAEVRLKPCGSVLKGKSPLRPDKEPSFVVWPHTQTWRDFSGGGGEGGDCFDYVMRRDGVSFREAMARLAGAAGLELPGVESPELAAELAQISERRRLEILLTAAAIYYHSVLPTKVRADLYAKRYGFSEDTVDGLMLGWADGHLHTHFIDELGITPEEALKTGLFIKLGSELKDFFQDRLVFPYWLRGRVVYFIARATEHTGDEPWEQAKYKKMLTHSDKHPYVSKLITNETFYNEDAARGADQVLITEGVTDCISARQAGVPCISPVTVRFRKKDHSKLLALTARTKRVVICNDSETNRAGEEGALETAQVLFAAGRDVRIASIPLPEGKDKIDVNELVATQGPEALNALLAKAKRLPEFLIERLPEETAKVDLSAALQPLLTLIRSVDPVQQEAYLDLIKRRFKLRAATVRALLRPSSQREEASDSRHPKERPEEIKGQVFEEADHYYIIGRCGEPVLISSFAIEPTRRVLVEDGEILDGDVTTVSGRVFRNLRFPRDAWHCKRSLLRVLGSVDLQFTGSDDNVQGVLHLLSQRSVPQKKGTLNLGYHETQGAAQWVVPGGALNVAGEVTGDDTVVYVPSGDSLSGRIGFPLTPGPEAEAATAAVVLPNLLRLNTPEVMLPIIGWFFAAPLKPRIQKSLGHFPILCVWASPGAGKSTVIMEVMWPLFGVTSSEPFSATETEFALLKLLSATNSVPVFIDEYKPFDMPKFRRNTLHRYMRRLYTGEMEDRGRANQTLASYRLSAPLCLAGETRPIEAALVERIITANPLKDQLLRDPTHAAALKAIKTVNPSLLTASLIRHLLGRDTAADVKLATDLVAGVVGNREVPLRFRDNLAAVVTGLLHFEGWAESLGVALPELDLDRFVAAQCKDLLESGGTAVKTGLDYFLETLSSLAISGKLECGRQYYYSGGFLALHVPSCHAAYAEHCRRTDYEGEIIDKKALVRQFQENFEHGGYVVELNKLTSFGSRADKRRAIHIDLEKAKALLEVDDFPQGENSGGSSNRKWEDKD